MSAQPQQWSARRHLLLGFFALFLLVAGFGGWAVMAQIDGAIIASGRIEVERNRQVVQHDTGGIVAQINVDDGDVVAAGDVLIRLDGQRLLSQMSIIEGQLYELVARRGRLEAERDGRAQISFEQELLDVMAENADLQELVGGQRNLFEARHISVEQSIEQLGKQRSQIANQIDGIDSQNSALATQLELIEQELVSKRDLLAKGLGQLGPVLALDREKARLSGQIGELTASKAQAQGRMTEIDLEVLNLRTRFREEAITQLRDLRSQELELREQRRAAQAQIDRLEIRAPVSGIVYALEVQTPRSVVRAAEPLMYLVPQDRPLVIAARVETIHIDQIDLGQQVNLRFSALDQRSTPELLGQVVLISADTLEDAATGLSYYRAEITLNPGEFEKLPEGSVLVPGMPVEAFIRTGERSPLAYLIKPMADYFARAFRES
ncbi:MAG: HlyD family type I secretion periplasmic adaptor subunit [Sulfitobacter sp.]